MVMREFIVETDSKLFSSAGEVKTIKIPMYAHVSKMVLYGEFTFKNGDTSPSYNTGFPFIIIRKITLYGNGAIPLLELKGSDLKIVSEFMTGQSVEYDSADTTAGATKTYKFRVILPVFQPATAFSYLDVKIELETLSNIGSDITFNSGKIKILPVYELTIPFVIRGYRQEKTINGEDSFTLPIGEKPKWIILKSSNLSRVKLIHNRKEIINATADTLRAYSNDLLNKTADSGLYVVDLRVDDLINSNTQFRVTTSSSETVTFILFTIIGEATRKETVRSNPKLVLF